MWYLFLLVVAALTALLVWDLRRKAAAREAASKERFEQMFKAKNAAPAPATLPETAIETATATAPAPRVVAIAATAAVATAPARERFLGQRETLIFRLLKAGIPDHDTFANVTLASVVAVPGGGFEGEQQLRRISQVRIDFVVCDKSMRVIAAIEVESAAGAVPTGDQRFKADCLKAAGIGLVRINPAALPRREAIRALVCGQPNPAGS